MRRNPSVPAYSLKRIGRVLSEERVRLGVTQHALAHEMGTLQSHISEIEVGHIAPVWDTIVKYLACLQLIANRRDFRISARAVAAALIHDIEDFMEAP